MASHISGPSAGGSPPQAVNKITKIAQDYQYNAAVPLKYWLRTAATLMREVGQSPPIELRIAILINVILLLGSNLRARRPRRASLSTPFSTCPAGPGKPVKTSRCR